jgi:anti-sigma-K factor RskA
VNPPSLNRPSPSDPELDALLGAYALDAVDPDERARVDEYLAVNPLARDEVDELRESAASLALAPVDDLTAPPALWDRISSRLADEPRVLTTLQPRGRRFLSPRVVAGLAAVAAVAIVVLAAQVIVLRARDTSSPSNLAAAFDKAATQTGAREVALAPATGARVARIVLLPDGTGYLKNDDMKPLPPDRTYQLWALSGTGQQPIAISAGVLGSSPRTVGFHTSGVVRGFGLTVEKTPGVVSSTQPLYASATVS